MAAEEEFSAITDKIPQRPVTVTEAGGYSLVIVAALGVRDGLVQACVVGHQCCAGLGKGRQGRRLLAGHCGGPRGELGWCLCGCVGVCVWGGEGGGKPSEGRWEAGEQGVRGASLFVGVGWAGGWGGHAWLASLTACDAARLLAAPPTLRLSRLTAAAAPYRGGQWSPCAVCLWVMRQPGQPRSPQAS